jgi:hypothetical protein
MKKSVHFNSQINSKSTNKNKESRGVPLMNKLSLQSVNMGEGQSITQLSNSTTFFYCTLKIEL